MSKKQEHRPVSPGDYVAISFWDHCEGSDFPLIFVVCGRLAHEREGWYVVDSWYNPTSKPHEPIDDNSQRYTIVKGAVIDVKRLVRDEASRT